jgi:alcohol dehydrogenase class IV
MPPARRSISFGDDALGTLPTHLAGGDHRTFLVTGKASFDASGASGVLRPLMGVTEVRRWCDFAPDPNVDDLWNGLQLINDFGADVIIGIGGGSVMDMAKLLCAFRGSRSAAELEATIRSGRAVDARGVRLMLAPTTSGSGSEATHFAVVYIGADKFSVAGPALRPDFTALDPNLACSGSARQRATSGIDAVCQAIESRWAAGATRRSRRYAEIALRALLSNIEELVDEPASGTAKAMQFGSHLSGRAIDISKTTAAHALAYGISKRYGVDHGNAAALTLPHFIEIHNLASPGDLNLRVEPREHAAAMRFVLDSLGASDGVEARDTFVALLARLGLSLTLTSVGYESPDELDALARSVNTQRLGNNPMHFDEKSLRDVLARAVG